jgi:hypothetical protein
MDVRQWIECRRSRRIKLKNGLERVDSSLIDHIYYNSDELVINVLPNAFSDHYLVSVFHPLIGVSCARKKVVTRDWRHYCREKLKKSYGRIN